MCGFVGAFFNQEFDKETFIPKLKNACQEIKSRGPDALNIFFNNKLALGFNRLKIQDLSDSANQPFFDEEKKICVVFNGQIYNHPSLKKELEKLGFKFKTNCDTETILLALKAWGSGCFDKLKGMFAAAFFEFEKKKLTIVRDRFGIKPMYFHKSSTGLFFSSQLNSLETLCEKEKIINNLAKYHYLSLLATPAPLTIYQDYFKLPAGYFATYENGKFETTRWYDIKSSLLKNQAYNYFDFSNDAAILEQTNFLLQKSVEEHLIGEEKISVFLSGGIDSSLIAYFAAKKTKISAFHLDLGNQETSLAQKIAEKIGCELKIIKFDKNSIESTRIDFLKSIDDPLADPVCLSFLFLTKYINQQGFKVALVGEGSDEIFWGYKLYFKHLYLNKAENYIPKFLLNKIASHLPPYAKFATERLIENKNSFLSGSLGFLPSELQKNAVDQKSQDMIHDFFKHTNIDYFDVSTWRNEVFCDDEKYFSQQELFHRLPESLLMRADKMGMRHSLEARVPFLDHELVEFALKIPLTKKSSFFNPKFILTQIYMKLFETSQHFQKIGFTAPSLNNASKTFFQDGNIKNWSLKVLENFEET